MDCINCFIQLKQLIVLQITSFITAKLYYRFRFFHFEDKSYE